jgi:glutathione S-transferase
MKLYHCPNTRSERVMWMFRELGVVPEIHEVNLFTGESRKPEYLAINPTGFVPTLVDGDLTLVESAAIILHLGDKFPEKKLAPPIGTRERASYYEYVVYGPATLDPALETVAYHSMVLPEAIRVAGAPEYGRRRFKRIAKALSVMLGDRRYVLGEAFSGADIVIASGLEWAKRLGMLDDAPPSLAAYHERCVARPGFAGA